MTTLAAALLVTVTLEVMASFLSLVCFIPDEGSAFLSFIVAPCPMVLKDADCLLGSCRACSSGSVLVLPGLGLLHFDGSLYQDCD